MTTTAWSDPARPVEERVEALLGEMTLREKLAQLGSAWVREAELGDDVAPLQDVFTAGDLPFEQLREHGLGHLTRVFGTAPVSVQQGTDSTVEFQLVGPLRHVGHDRVLTTLVDVTPVDATPGA